VRRLVLKTEELVKNHMLLQSNQES
jgi:hypothetical protein